MSQSVVLLQFKTPSKVALFRDLKALLTAAGMGGFLPVTAGGMTNPWLRAGYRLDWVFFRVVRTLEAATEEDPAVTVDRGLHCDVLVSRTDPDKPTVRQKLSTLRERIRDLPEEDHDSPQELLDKHGKSRLKIRRGPNGSRVMKDVESPAHRFLGFASIPSDDAVIEP